MKLECECIICKAVYEFVAFLARMGEGLKSYRCDVCRNERRVARAASVRASNA